MREKLLKMERSPRKSLPPLDDVFLLSEKILIACTFIGYIHNSCMGLEQGK